MITIIKKGKETYKLTCPICECEFSYQDEDLRNDSLSNNINSEVKRVVKCPCCGAPLEHSDLTYRGGIYINKN